MRTLIFVLALTLSSMGLMAQPKGKVTEQVKATPEQTKQVGPPNVHVDYDEESALVRKVNEVDALKLELTKLRAQLQSQQFATMFEQFKQDPNVQATLKMGQALQGEAELQEKAIFTKAGVKQGEWELDLANRQLKRKEKK